MKLPQNADNDFGCHLNRESLGAYRNPQSTNYRQTLYVHFCSDLCLVWECFKFENLSARCDYIQCRYRSL